MFSNKTEYIQILCYVQINYVLEVFYNWNFEIHNPVYSYVKKI